MSDGGWGGSRVSEHQPSAEQRMVVAIGVLRHEVHDLTEETTKLRRLTGLAFSHLFRRLGVIINMEEQELQDLSAIVDEVGPLTDVVTANNALLDRLADMLEEAAPDPQQVLDIAASIRAQRDSISEAIVRDTPAETPPVEPPVDPNA